MRLSGVVFGLVAVLLAVAPADAKVLFQRGAFVCTSKSANVTAMTVGRCNWGFAKGMSRVWGRCEGSLTINRVTRTFTAAGVMSETKQLLPDNTSRLTFSYPGVSCSWSNPRLKSVRNCRYSNGGRIAQCQICAEARGKRCYTARLAITPVKAATMQKSSLRPAP